MANIKGENVRQFSLRDLTFTLCRDLVKAAEIHTARPGHGYSCSPGRDAPCSDIFVSAPCVCPLDTSLYPSFLFSHRETCRQPPALGCSTPAGRASWMGRAAVGKAYVEPHLASKRLPASSLPLPYSTIYSFQMPPLRNHTSYYSEDYFVGTLNIFVGSLAPSTLTAHSITFTQDWKRLVILLLSGTPLLAYYCFPLQYRSKLDVRHRKMPAKAPVHSQEPVTGQSPKPDTHWHVTINTRFAMRKPFAIHLFVSKDGEKQGYCNIFKYLQGANIL